MHGYLNHKPYFALASSTTTWNNHTNQNSFVYPQLVQQLSYQTCLAYLAFSLGSQNMRYGWSDHTFHGGKSRFSGSVQWFLFVV